MKILVLNIEYPPVGGGVAKICAEISERYVRQGHDVTVVSMGMVQRIEKEKRNGLDIIWIPAGRKMSYLSTPLEHLRFIRNAKRFLKIHLKANSYDFCHCHFMIPTGLIARWVKKHYGVPYIVTIHGSDVPHYNPDRFKLLHTFTKPLISRVSNDAEAIASSSQYLLNLLSQEVSSTKKTAQVHIRNGYSLPHKVLNLEKKNIILSTGRLLRRKGFHTLIKAVSDIALDYEVHICGDGPMMDELKSMAQGSKTPIVFHGWIDNASDTYMQLLTEARIYALVSSHENASISILEAMYNQCAVITSDGTGCKEMVEGSGICLPPDDHNLLKNEIIRLTNDADLCAAYGKSAKEEVLKNYNWDTIADEYLEVMQKSLN